MQDLTPVGLSADGRRLFLLNAAGEEFAVAVDHRLRIALRGDAASNARLGQLEIKMESALRPREIQARIRAGETVEEVAAAAQTTVEAITGFATPVLAERAHLAATALSGSLRRPASEAAGPLRTLAQACQEAAVALGLRFEEIEWDAWRREDGRWTVTADFTLDGKDERAEFTYDQPGRYATVANQAARRLTGTAAAPTVAAPTTSPTHSAADDELPLGDAPQLGDDAIRLVHSAPPAADLRVVPPTESDDEPTTDLHPAQDPAALLADGLTASHADADWIAPDEVHRARTGDEETLRSDAAPTSEPVTDPPAKSRRRGRSSVPSWDEIMFGGASE